MGVRLWWCCHDPLRNLHHVAQLEVVGMSGFDFPSFALGLIVGMIVFLAALLKWGCVYKGCCLTKKD